MLDRTGDPSIRADLGLGGEAGLVYVETTLAGYTRRRVGKAFAYYDTERRLIRDKAELARIKSIGVPPAYTNVWICPHADGHIQAIGFDARGRRQYRYHLKWGEASNAAKFERLTAFAEALPTLRATVDSHLRLTGLKREKVLATVVRLLETTLIRIGNDSYARENKSYGLTTLRNRHVQVEQHSLRFEFRGKSGKLWRLTHADRRIARVVRECQELPGQRLFQYLDGDGERCSVSSSDVNEYLRQISGIPGSAKDFRTWAATWRAANAFSHLPPFASKAEAKRNVRAVIVETAKLLGNTPAICRKSYIHPHVVAHYLDGGAHLVHCRTPEEEVEGAPHSLRPEELGTLRMLEALRNAPPP